MFRLLLAIAYPIAVVCFSAHSFTLRPSTMAVKPIGSARSCATPGLSMVSTGAFFGGETTPREILSSSLQSKVVESKVVQQELQSKTVESLGFTETTLRSAVKAILWRMIAGSVTFATSYKISGSLATAVSIVASDFFSKAGTMFIGERLMNRSKAGRESGSDGLGRSLAKALIWRLFAICNTMTLAFFVAKDLSMASKVAGVDAFFKTGLMFFYERAWAKIQWGKNFEEEMPKSIGTKAHAPTFCYE